MKNLIRIFAMIIAFTFTVPNSATAASATSTEVSGYSLFKSDVRKKKKVRARKKRTRSKRARKSRKKTRRSTRSNRKKYKTRSARSKAKSRSRAKARRLAQKKRKARARRAAAAKRKKLYSRQNVTYRSRERRGTIIVDTRTRHLYHIKGNGRATRYGVAVGKQGYGWRGTSRIRRKVTWPTWTPPKEMIERSPKLAKWKNGQPGGPSNPLGAAALYLFQGKKDTLYRIHGTNNPGSIGTASSSGCIRMRNEDIQHLYSRVKNGTKVIVR